MAPLVRLLLLLAAAAAPAVGSNWTASPARTLPNLNGSAFPAARHRFVFEAGECNRADALPTSGHRFPLPNGGTTQIDPDKVCFSCFRVPTLLAGQSPGVIHAFAEGRRGELAAAGGCPDGPALPNTRFASRSVPRARFKRHR